MCTCNLRPHARSHLHLRLVRFGPAQFPPHARAAPSHEGATAHRLGCSVRCRALFCNASSAPPQGAKQAVEAGLRDFEGKRYDQALRQFEEALSLDPRPEEAQAAIYNLACCYVKTKQWQRAAEAVAEAVNSYNLRLKVALEDKDLAPLRERREWRDVAESLQGALSSRNLVGVRAEQRSPFRLLRLLLSGGLGAGALVGLLIIATRLFGALKGGDGAPNLTETLQNLAINGVAVAVLGFIFRRDLQGSQSDRKLVEREESLARLQVSLGPDRAVTLDTLRGTVRPVIVTGSKGQVSRSVKAAQPLLEALRDRGISVIPLVLSEDDPDMRLAALKSEFRPSKGFGKEDAPTPSPSGSPQPSAPRSSTPGRRFEIQPYNKAEWFEWLRSLKEEARVSGDHFYVQVQLDGSVRSSGVGSPPWERFCGDLASLDSVRTKMTDGLRK